MTIDSGSVAAGNEETGVAGHSVADVVLIPAFKGMLAVINLVQNFSPIDSLSTGRSDHLGRTGPGVRADRLAARRNFRAWRASSFSAGANWRRRKERNERARQKNYSAAARRRAAVQFRPVAKIVEPRPRPARPDAHATLLKTRRRCWRSRRSRSAGFAG